MADSAFLKMIGKDPSVLVCSLCEEKFHTSSVGQLQPAKNFREHVKDKHPGAVLQQEDANQPAYWIQRESRQK